MYYDDEYDCYDGYDDEPESWSVFDTLWKSENGHLVMVRDICTRYRGMWSHEVIWTTDYYRMGECEPWFVAKAIEWSRTAENNTSVEINYLYDGGEE